MDDFNKQIISWQRITQKPTFCLTEPKMIVLDSMAFLSNIGRQKYWLLAVLNSDLIYFWAKLNVHEYGDTGFRLSNQYVEQITIPRIEEELLEKINNLIISQIKEFSNTNEGKIQKLIYQIYKISDEEIKIINSRIK